LICMYYFVYSDISELLQQPEMWWCFLCVCIRVWLHEYDCDLSFSLQQPEMWCVFVCVCVYVYVCMNMIAICQLQKCK